MHDEITDEERKEFLDRLIRRELYCVERRAKIVDAVGGWFVITALGVIGTLVWQGAKMLLSKN